MAKGKKEAPIIESGEKATAVPKGTRSPNYPTINIEKAITMVTGLYNKYQRHAVPAPLAMEAMGYSISSGRSQSMLASLAYFELVQVERGPIKTKKVSISQLGFKIINYPDQNERRQAIQEAALKPVIFKKLHDKFPEEIPQDSLLKWELESTHGFNPKTIPDVIASFRETMDFAKIYESGIIEEEKGAPEDKKIDEKGDEDMGETPLVDAKKHTQEKPYVPLQGEREVANYPIGRGLKARIVISGDTPVRLDTIEKLIKLLEINKEDLTEGNGGSDITGN